MYVFNAAAGAATALPVFALTASLAGPEAGLFAAAAQAGAPIHAAFSRTGDMTVFSVLLLACALAGWLLLERRPRP